MSTVSASPILPHVSIDQKIPEENKDQKSRYRENLKEYSEKLSQVIKCIAFVALVAATSTMTILIQTKNTTLKKISDYTSEIYIVAELALIGALIAIVALKVFIKILG